MGTMAGTTFRKHIFLPVALVAIENVKAEGLERQA